MKLWSAFLILAAWMVFSPAYSAQYVLDKKVSVMRFSGEHAGKPFQGTFEQWDADIQFDKDVLEKSRIQVTIKTGSAKTGDKMYDGTLPSQDWFDVINYPTAQFISKRITLQEDGQHKMEGYLTIKQHKHPVVFSFRLEESEDSNVTTQFSFPIKRLDFAIGKESDAKAEWVSSDILINVTLKASRQ
jgi:cytochrome b561